MELKIYNQSDVLKLTLNSDSSSTHTQELNGADNLAITATAFSCVKLDVNDYVIIDDVRYSIKSPYLPQKKSNSEYEYRVNLYAPIHDAEQAMFFNLTDGQYNSEFSLDGSPTEHLQKWVDNMNRLYDTDKWSIGTVIVAANKTIDYNNIYCWDAAFGDSGIAKTFETEMWADGYTINLCKCERGEMVELGYLNGLTSLTQDDNDSSVKFFTRLIPLGSTKNIDPASYGYSRLQLPSRAKWVDRNTDYGIYEYNEEKAFAGIFPHYIGTVTSVRSEEKTGENGTYTVYYFNDSALPFNPSDYEIAGLVKQLSFTSGDLNGREFEANWHADTSEWEIINIYPDNDTQIPGGNLIPRVGDSYFPWNIKMPQSYITAAENDYKAAVDDLLAKYSDSKNKYIASTDYIDITKRNINLRIGQLVKLSSSEYFTDGYINIRIVKVVRKLDELNDATITLSHQAEGNWTSSVDNSINDLKYVIAQKSEQLAIDIIKSYDSNEASNANVFSALRSLSEFVSKKNDGKVAGTLTFDKIQKFLKGFQSSGLVKIGDAIDSMTAGKGVILTPDGLVQADILQARYAAVFREVIFNRLSAQEGDTAFSDSGLIESLTLETDGTYTLHLRKRWENDFTSFQDNDILLGDVNDLMNNGTYYTSWVRVLSVNTANNSISVVVYPDAEVPGGVNHIPAELMRLVRRGNAVNTDRQGYWYLSATSEKCFVWLEGVNKPILEESNYYMMAGRPKNLSLFSNLPLSYQQAAFFARAAIVQNIFRVDVTGAPVVDVLPGVPWVRDTAYTSSNTQAQTVYHYGCRYQCIVPSTTQEPKYGATDWAMIEGNPSFTIEIESSNGWYFEPATLQTTLSVKGLLYNQNVTNDILDADVSWTRETGDITEDNAWVVTRANAGKSLAITVNDLGPNYMHQIGCKFKVTAVLRDGLSAETFITM